MLSNSLCLTRFPYGNLFYNLNICIMKQNLFNTVKMTKPPRNIFDLTHDFKFSCDMGELIPIMVMDVVPGDIVNCSSEILVRYAPLLAPMMHRVDVYTHTFFVPNRLTWENWETWITSYFTSDPPPAAPYLVFEADANEIPRLANYLGVPQPEPFAAEADFHVSALPFAAYQLIYKEYYRDQNLQNPWADSYTVLADGNNGSGSDGNNLTVLQRRAWEHDYFTACLPFAQKGEPVSLPLGGFADVPVFKANFSISNPDVSWTDSVGSSHVSQDVVPNADPYTGKENYLFANTSDLDATSVPINDLRVAFRLQEFLEKDARGGTRYIEHIRAHFGVMSSDKRLQRPEYITGSKSPVVISEVLNTTGTEDAPQGNMAGHGISVTQGNYGKYFVEEHGYILTIMSIMPKTAYQQGLPRHFSRLSDPLDYYFPEFANLGEQAVLNKEIFAWGSDQDGTFGYNPRYSEMRYIPSRVAGDFASSLNFWHMGRIFVGQPTLNANFVVADPTKRVFAVTDGPQSIWCHALNKVTANRLMPKFGTPSF